MENSRAKPSDHFCEEPTSAVAIILLSYNQKELTLRCIASLMEVAPSCTIVLWDNGSSDGTGDAVRSRFPQTLVRWQKENLGVAGGRNAAAAFAIEAISPTFLLFMDNDTVATAGFVEALVAPLVSNPELGQTAPKLRLLNDPDRLDVAGGCRLSLWRGGTEPVGHGEIDRGQYDSPGPCIPAGCMMVRTSVFQELGGFDPSFNPYGPEDLDFSLRARKAGYRAVYVPGSLIFHDRSRNVEGNHYTERYARNKSRLLWRFVRRHGSVAEITAFLLIGAPIRFLSLVFREVRRGNPRAISGALSGVFQRSVPQVSSSRKENGG